MKKTRMLSLALAAALLVLPMAGCTQDGGSGSDGDTIKIGGLAPLTGDLSQYGVAVNNAVLMAVEDINENGGVLGKQIEYLPEDEKGDITEALNAYNKLVSEGVGAIVGPVQGGGQAGQRRRDADHHRVGNRCGNHPNRQIRVPRLLY